MTMVYDNRPATKDIDCVFSDANPAPFRVRNVYFDLEGVGRV